MRWVPASEASVLPRGRTRGARGPFPGPWLRALCREHAKGETEPRVSLGPEASAPWWAWEAPSQRGCPPSPRGALSRSTRAAAVSGGSA